MLGIVASRPDVFDRILDISTTNVSVGRRIVQTEASALSASLCSSYSLQMDHAQLDGGFLMNLTRDSPTASNFSPVVAQGKHPIHALFVIGSATHLQAALRAP